MRYRRATKNTPRVTVNCTADAHSGVYERIVEFTFPSGKGGLLRFACNPNGDECIEIYRTHAHIRIGLPGQTVWHHTPQE